MKNIYIKIFIFIFVITSHLFSQFLNEKVLIDNNGYLYVVAQKNCPSDSDIVVIKYNPITGTEIWANQSEVTGTNFLSTAILSGNNIYIIGVNHLGANKKALILKCDLNGNFSSAFYNQPGGNYGNSITTDNSNNIYIAGRSDLPLNYPKFLVVKFNSNLDSTWSYRYTGAYSGNFDEALSIKADNTGNIYATGYTSSGQTLYDTYDYLTIKLNPSGILQWDRKHDGTAHKQDVARIIVLDSNNNSYVTGYSYSTGCSIFTIKYNTNGDSLASSQYSCPGSSLNFPTASILDNSKNLYITGLGQCGSSSNFDYLTIKYDSTLSTKWYKTYISSGNSVSYSAAYSYSHVYITGESDSSNGNRRFLTLKYDASNGNELYRWFVGTSDSNYAISIVTDSNDNAYVAGYSSPDTIITAKYSFWTDKYYNCQPFGIKKISNSVPGNYNLFQNYPNPFNPITNIKYQIPVNTSVKIIVYDITGKEVKLLVNEIQSPGQYQADWDASNFPSGVYFYSLTAGMYTESKKMLLIK